MAATPIPESALGSVGDLEAIQETRQELDRLQDELLVRILYIENTSVTTLARRLGWPRGTVASRKHYLGRRLHEFQHLFPEATP